MCTVRQQAKECVVLAAVPEFIRGGFVLNQAGSQTKLSALNQAFLALNRVVLSQTRSLFCSNRVIGVN